MKIAIIGVRGQLGSELYGILRKGSGECGTVLESYKGAEVIPLDVKELDITDRYAVCRHYAENGIDLTINCAAYTNVDGCESNEQAARAVNATGARNIASAANETGGAVVYVSTDYVFDGNGSYPYSETDKPNPQTIYGKTKLEGEQLTAAHCARHYITRTAWLYGYHGGNFVKTIARAARERGKLSVVNDQTGNPTNAHDLAYQILQIVATGNYGIYHTVGPAAMTWYDFTREILSRANISCVLSPCSTDEFPRPAKRPTYSVLDTSKLRDSGIYCMREFGESLSAFIGNGGLDLD